MVLPDRTGIWHIKNQTFIIIHACFLNKTTKTISRLTNEQPSSHLFLTDPLLIIIWMVNAFKFGWIANPMLSCSVSYCYRSLVELVGRVGRAHCAKVTFSPDGDRHMVTYGWKWWQIERNCAATRKGIMVVRYLDTWYTVLIETVRPDFQDIVSKSHPYKKLTRFSLM